MKRPTAQTVTGIRADRMKDKCYVHVHLMTVGGCLYVDGLTEGGYTFSCGIDHAYALDVSQIEHVTASINQTFGPLASDLCFFVCEEVNRGVPLAQRLKYGLR